MCKYVYSQEAEPLLLSVRGVEDSNCSLMIPTLSGAHTRSHAHAHPSVVKVFYNQHLMPILRELVISGGANSGNFHETDVQPSVLYSLAVPSSFTGASIIRIVYSSVFGTWAR